MSGFLLVDSLEAMLLVAIAPEGWAAMAVLIAVAVAAQRRADRESPDEPLPGRAGWFSGLALLLVVPVGLLVAATQTGGTPDAGLRNVNEVYYTLVAILVAQLALGSGLIWWHRRRWLPTVLFVGGLCWWALGAGFIAYMSLTDNWM